MEEELSRDLLRCADAYVKAKGMKLSTIARLAAGDWRFFDNLKVDNKTFTVRKYDEVLQYFSNNWPADKDWPKNLARPAPAESEKAG